MILRMVKRDLASFLGSKSPYAIFCIKEALNNWRMLLGEAGWEGGFHSQPREWQTELINSMQGTSVW